ncbi:hypothetical protein ONZ45_g16006 [Pleurotus djamor]|nr:hypothetical protein ONZ45_g16006 [Pleurotus djamor]
MAEQSSIVVPPGFKLHTENHTHILLPDSNEAFLNPVQEFNRDLSIACIRVWSEELDKTKEARWRESQTRKQKASAKKLRTEPPPAESSAEATDTPPQKELAYTPYKFTLLEALSATGLRSIRYAHEIPLLRYVIANDLSPSAVEAIKRNVDLNGLGEHIDEATSQTEPGKVRINEGDAW